MKFFRTLSKRIVLYGLNDVTSEVKHLPPDFIGIRTTLTTIDLVATTQADNLSKEEITKACEECFHIVRSAKKQFHIDGLEKIRNTNGLLLFIFEKDCPLSKRRFICKRGSRIAHTLKPGVMVSWAIDVPNKQIHTHQNPVSWFPPVMIAASAEGVTSGLAIFPGKNVIQRWLNTYQPPKTKILFLAANPVDSARLGLDREFRAIRDRIRMSEHRDRLELVQEWATTPANLMQILLEQKPDILHFAGHGETTGICLHDNDDKTLLINTEALANFLGKFNHHVKYIILNACHSANLARELHKFIPYVIGMKSSILDEAAIAFAESFYGALGAGQSYQSAFEMGLLVSGLKVEESSKLPVLYSSLD